MHANKVNEFCPISLVTSLYKIIANVLIERLKKVLHLIVDDAQSTFADGRQILDAMIVAAEVVGDWNASKKVATCLSWTMKKLMTWLTGIILTRSLIRKASIEDGINDRPRGKIHAKRGLKQGDPLSPFLSTLIGDSFSGLLNYCCKKRMIGV